MSNVITLQDVQKTYRKKTIFTNLSFTIPEHRLVGVFGANGAGKSTLFRMLMGFTPYDRGKVEVLGTHPGRQNHAQIAYLHDRGSWFPHHTVSDAIAWGARFLPQYNVQIAEELMELMRLRKDMIVQEMSKGQAARLMLIQSLSRDVPLMLLDEPFSGIDLVSREVIIDGLIAYIGNRQQTVLISTHEIAEAEGLFDYVLFLREGEKMIAEEADTIREEFGSLQSLFRRFD